MRLHSIITESYLDISSVYIHFSLNYWEINASAFLSKVGKSFNKIFKPAKYFHLWRLINHNLGRFFNYVPCVKASVCDQLNQIFIVSLKMPCWELLTNIRFFDGELRRFMGVLLRKGEAHSGNRQISFFIENRWLVEIKMWYLLYASTTLVIWKTHLDYAFMNIGLSSDIWNL